MKRFLLVFHKAWQVIDIQESNKVICEGNREVMKGLCEHLNEIEDMCMAIEALTPEDIEELPRVAC